MTKKIICILLVIVTFASLTGQVFAFPNLTMVGKTTSPMMASTIFADKISLMVGESCRLLVDNTLSCHWTSSNERVATVSQDGVVLGLRNGTTTITLTDIDLKQITIKLDFIIGTGIEEVQMFSQNKTVNEKTIKGYLGPGFSIVAFEAGPLSSRSSDEDIQKVLTNGATLSPSLYGDYDYPSYGTCQMVESNIKGFYNWMMKDKNRKNLWNKIFDGTPIVCEGDSEFTYRWRNASEYLTDDEYILFGSYQIEYMYRNSGLYEPTSSNYKMIAATGIDPNRSRVLQEFFFACYNQGAFNTAFENANVNGDMTDEEIIKAVCEVYGTKINWSAGLTNGMRAKWYGDGDGAIYRYYIALAKANLPIFSFGNVEQNVFVSAPERATPEISFEIVVERRPMTEEEKNQMTEPVETEPPIETEPPVEETKPTEPPVQETEPVMEIPETTEPNTEPTENTEPITEAPAVTEPMPTEEAEPGV